MAASGKLEITSIQDLGGLGDKQGAPVAYTWTPVSLFPHVIPWLVLLGLLVLPQNRQGKAWWIWAALGGGLGVEALLRAAEPLVASQPVDMLAKAVAALSFALAFTWLMLAAKERRSRLKTFFVLLLLLAGMGAGAYELAALQADSEPYVHIFELILVLMQALVICLALTFAGLVCRRRYRPGLLLGWTFAGTLIFTLLAILPFLVFAIIESGPGIQWSGLLLGTVLLAAVSFGILLPFLVLSLLNRLFRERLKSVLQLAVIEKAPMLTPSQPLEMEVR